MTLFRSLALLAAFLFAGSASADSLGDISFTEPKGFTGSVPDEVTFGLAADATVGISLTNVFLTVAGQTYNQITDFNAGIYDAGDNSLLHDLAFTSTPAGPATVQLLTFSGLLGQGQYKLVVGGTAIGNATYGGNLVAAPVPVPAAVWLLGSALVGMVSIRRRAA